MPVSNPMPDVEVLCTIQTFRPRYRQLLWTWNWSDLAG